MPYMFTENTPPVLDWLIPAGVLASGLMLNLSLTKKGPLILAWVLGFAGQAVVRSVAQDVALLAALSPMTGVAFILFTNYMITDPATSPVRPRNQVVFGALTAALYGLITGLHVVYGIFFGLAIACALRGVVLWAVQLRDGLRERRPAAPAVVLTSPEAAAGGRHPR
jgi:Na+-translocating ferredoxin:NAD+ oxidoreductase RnfD subunit